jgi:hypothetical protein
LEVGSSETTISFEHATAFALERLGGECRRFVVAIGFAKEVQSIGGGKQALLGCNRANNEMRVFGIGSQEMAG